MKINSTRIRSVLSVVAILYIASCDVLDQEPVNAISNDYLFSNPSDADAAIMGAYSALLGKGYVGGRFTALLEVPTGNVTATPAYNDFNLMNQFLFYPENEALSQTWRDIYIGINRANLILDKLPGIDDQTLEDRKPGILGEARFLRAFHYFNLVQLFGDVPLLTSATPSSDLDDLKGPRASSDKIYDLIFDDLAFAEENLPDDYASTMETKGRATKGAAKALLSRIHLYLKNYDEAADKALEVLESQDYELSLEYASVFEDQLTTESIWEVQFSNQFRNDLVYYYLPGGLGGWLWLKPSDDIMQSYEPGDERKSFTFASHGDEPYVRKYFRISSGLDNIVIIRLPEVILTRAEALAEVSYPNTESLDLLNAIRVRAGLDEIQPEDVPTLESFRRAIWKERRLELAFEGHEWNDLVRTDRLDDELGISDPNMRLLPVPQSERNRNPELTQNPGY